MLPQAGIRYRLTNYSQDIWNELGLHQTRMESWKQVVFKFITHNR